MQMMIGQIANVQNGAAAGGKTAVSVGASAKGFGTMLVQTIGGGDTAAASGQLQLQSALAAGLLGGAMASLLAEGTSGDLNAKLTELLSALQNGGAGSEEDEQSAEALQDLLKQFDELIASILGASTMLEAFKGAAYAQQDEVQWAEAAGSAGTIAAVKANLQTVLSQLQSLIQQGGEEVLTQEQAAEAAKLVAKLGVVLDSKAAASGGTTDADAAMADGLPTVQSGAAVHLQRMSQQAQNGGYFAGQQQEMTPVTVEAAAESQPVEQVFLSALQQAAESGAKTADSDKMNLPQVNVRQFADTMTGMIVKQFGITLNGGLSEAKISLLPEHLGQVDVRISVLNGQLTASFVTDNAAAKEMLENQMAQLRSALQTQGLQVEKLEVSQDNGQNGVQSQLFQEQRRQGSGGFQQSRRNGSGDSSVDDSLQGFERELAQQAAANGLGYGRAINITA